MTDCEKRSHDITIALISKKSYSDIQEAFVDYKDIYYTLYDYVKETFNDEA